MPDFTRYTYTSTANTTTFPYNGGYITTIPPITNPFTIDAGDLTECRYYGTYSDNFTYDTLIYAALREVGNLVNRMGHHCARLVMGTDVFNSLRDTRTVPYETMEKAGIVGYVGGVPVHISPDDALKKDVLAVIYTPFEEPGQYQKDDYVLDGDVIWRVASVDGSTVSLNDTSYRVLTGEHLAHPGRGKSGTIGTMSPIKRSPPPPPTQEEFNDLFGDVLPEET